MTVTFLDGITSAPLTASVKTDNSTTLELNDVGDVEVGVTISSGCGEGGVGGGDKLTHAQLRSLLIGSTPGSVSKIIIDKVAVDAGVPSTAHHVGGDLTAAGAGGRVRFWIGDPSYSPQAPDAPVGSSPLVTKTSTGGVDTYTFVIPLPPGSQGIALAKQLLGKPKEHPVVVCDLEGIVRFSIETP